MSVWWLIAAFAVGWLMCWHLSRFVVRHVLRRGDGFMTDSLAGLPQDSLIKVAAMVDKELAKRRST